MHSWAATVVFAATGRPPFGTGPAMAIMDRVRRGEHDLSAVPPALLPLVRACLAPDPADRPRPPRCWPRCEARPDGDCRGNGRPVRDDPTMPFALATPDPDGRSQPAPPTRIAGPSVLPARPRAVHAAAGAGAAAPRLVPPRRLAPAAAAACPAASAALLLAGLFATATLGFARAPYLCLLLAAVLALAVRTVSWTTESARQRQHLRGRRRWYDGPLTVARSPWYLVVATGGTLMLLLWAAFVAFVVGLRLPAVPGAAGARAAA